MCFSTIFLFLCNKIVHSTGIILLNKCIFSVIFINLIKYYPIKYQILHPIL